MKKLPEITFRPVPEYWKERLQAWLDEYRLERELRRVLPDETPEAEQLRSPGDEEFCWRAREMVRPFDPVLQEGEVRLLGPALSPDALVYVAVIARWSRDTFVVAPFSPYAEPATPAELLLAHPVDRLRVLQIWNAVIASARVLAESWVVDVLEESDRQDAWSLFANVLAGKELPDHLHARIGPPILTYADPRIAYEDEEEMKMNGLRRAAALEAESAESTPKLVVFLRNVAAARLAEAEPLPAAADTGEGYSRVVLVPTPAGPPGTHDVRDAAPTESFPALCATFHPLVPGRTPPAGLQWQVDRPLPEEARALVFAEGAEGELEYLGAGALDADDDGTTWITLAEPATDALSREVNSPERIIIVIALPTGWRSPEQ